MNFIGDTSFYRSTFAMSSKTTPVASSIPADEVKFPDKGQRVAAMVNVFRRRSSV
jgi:hypothetical protein